MTLLTYVDWIYIRYFTSDRSSDVDIGSKEDESQPSIGEDCNPTFNDRIYGSNDEDYFSESIYKELYEDAEWGEGNRARSSELGSNSYQPIIDEFFQCIYTELSNQDKGKTSRSKVHEYQHEVIKLLKDCQGCSSPSE